MFKNLPSSGPWQFRLRDLLKTLGIAILAAIGTNAPEIKAVLTSHDFGAYNDAVRIAIIVGVFVVQRWAKDNTHTKIEVPIDEAGTEP